MVQETQRAVVHATGLEKHFLMGNATVYALRGVDLTVEQGELVAIRALLAAARAHYWGCWAVWIPPAPDRSRLEEWILLT